MKQRVQVRLRRRFDNDDRPTPQFHFEVGNAEIGWIDVPCTKATIELDQQGIPHAVVTFLDPEVHLDPYLPGRRP